jgi:dihydroorotate dehydrogenase
MILGLNIGKNAATPIERATDDYLTGLAGVYPCRLRHGQHLQPQHQEPARAAERRALDALLAALKSRQGELAAEHGKRAAVLEDRARPG